jgi:hypothetical protein
MQRETEMNASEGKRKQWTRKNTVQTLKAVPEKGMCYLKTTKNRDVPHQTLFTSVNKGNYSSPLYVAGA